MNQLLPRNSAKFPLPQQLCLLHACKVNSKNNFPIVCIVFCWEFVFLVCLQYFQFGVSEVCTKLGTSKVHQTNILRKLRLRNSEKVVIVVTLNFHKYFISNTFPPLLKFLRTFDKFTRTGNPSYFGCCVGTASKLLVLDHFSYLN